MPLVASSCLVATSFQRVYGAVMTKSHFWASAAGPTVTSRASPSKRSMTIPFDSGKFLSGSASTTSPTVHFQPLAACLYTLDLLTSSLNCEAHWSEKALTAISSSLLEGKVTGTLPHVIADRDQARLHHPAVHPHPLVVPFDQQAKQLRRLLCRVRVHVDHLAALAAVRHLQLGLAGVDREA